MDKTPFAQNAVTVFGVGATRLFFGPKGGRADWRPLARRYQRAKAGTTTSPRCSQQTTFLLTRRK